MPGLRLAGPQAEKIATGKISDSTFFFFHREASTADDEDLDDPVQLRAAIREASGPAIMGWDDAEGQVESIASLYHQAARRGNAAYFERVWLNRRKQGSRQAFDRKRWDELARPHDPPLGASITLGLDGSKWRDSTGIVATDLVTGWQWLVGWWENDFLTDAPWEVPVDEVEGVLDATYDSFDVVRFYGDPANGWDQILARRIGKYGPKRVVEFYTDSRGLRRIAVACRSHSEAVRGGGLTHSGDPRLAAHIGAAVKRDVHIVDDDGHKLWVLEKERRDSPFKVDYAMAAVISWAAYLDALTAGWAPPVVRPRRMVVMG